MASYRYLRDIKPEDLVPEAEPELTPRQKCLNWWHYHWVIVLVCVAAAGAIVWFAHDIIRGFQNKTDTSIALVGPTMSDTKTAALSAIFEPLATDVDGNGRTIFALNTYNVDFSSAGMTALDQSLNAESASSAASSTASSATGADALAEDFSSAIDPYEQMAADTRLSADFSDAVSGIFLIRDAKGFENYTGSLRYLNGTNADVDEDNVSPADWYNMVYRVSDCPVLVEMLSADTTGAGQDLIDNYYIGFRNCYDEKSAAALVDDELIWQMLTAGAVSTAGGDAA